MRVILNICNTTPWRLYADTKNSTKKAWNLTHEKTQHPTHLFGFKFATPAISLYCSNTLPILSLQIFIFIFN
jgi:hypothetical protein